MGRQDSHLKLLCEKKPTAQEIRYYFQSDESELVKLYFVSIIVSGI